MKRILSVLLILVLVLALFACGKEEEPRTVGETGTAATRETAGNDPALAEEQALMELDMTGKMESWRGSGGDGRVSLPGDWQAVIVQSLTDLAPYRQYFPTLTDPDAARITSDTEGIAAVLEIASPDLNLLYGVNEVTCEGGHIFLMVTAEPEVREEELTDEDGNVIEQAPGSPYEYFLFYIPAEHYNNEDLQFNFVN